MMTRSRFLILVLSTSLAASTAAAAPAATTAAKSKSKSHVVSKKVPVKTVKGISLIDYEFVPSAATCGHRRLMLHADNTAELYTTICKNGTTPSTACEVKQGTIDKAEFPRLATLIDNNGFEKFPTHYGHPSKEVSMNALRVVSKGREHEVDDYKESGSFPLLIIENSVSTAPKFVKWSKTETRPACPAWKSEALVAEAR